jgi:hypothetical protein
VGKSFLLVGLKVNRADALLYFCLKVLSIDYYNDELMISVDAVSFYNRILV